jgi:UDP-N-acetylmuramoylalanine-D-glutamate ligase
VLPALAAALSWGVEPKTLRELVYSWTGPAHSLQWAGSNRGISLFDDGSCCTSEGLARALSVFDQKITLVTGGPGFHAGFELLDRVRNGASRIVLLPGTPDWIVSAWSQLSDVRRAADLASAASLALECTPAGGQILFCPGSFPSELEHGVTRRGSAFAEEFLDA